MKNRYPSLVGLVCLFFWLTACTKQETVLVTDNDAPNVNNVPTIKIENFVNRVFIDLIGREPLDAELEEEVATLKTADLSRESRIALVTKLQTDDTPIEGDTSYTRAYHRQLYNQAKIRCLEGASDEDILSAGGEGGEREAAVVASRMELEDGLITIHEVFARMIYNEIYDEINMNTFNFVNASFDNLLWRYPTDAEFEAGFDMVEHQQSRQLFGQEGQNRDDYIRILTNSREMSEGLIIWVYRQLLARNPTTAETAALLSDFHEQRDLKAIQQHVMATNEYANFE